ncbi:MAG TPA: tRNA preQ1(34) S-adenosylmethionine ribosyltransferase-isomerase QueA [Blastocatellia bacterium]|nr:tRNA preQ1(34) S-adenosylmethionine ribosyltransferase-isomerase QueA [Blastocatellia bacterium]
MHISDFNYELPPELIAQEPPAERDRSRMLVIDRARHQWRDRAFVELPTLLDPDDVVVINNTRVFPARLFGRRIPAATESPQGAPPAPIEVLLTQPVGDQRNEWEVLAKPARPLRPGTEVDFGNGRLKGVVTASFDDGRRQIRFEGAENFDQIVDEIGNTPLPPYIKREIGAGNRLDEPRYQTVFASRRGAIAAPTAGLHFTPELFDQLRRRGVRIAEITHHVGYATFQPLRVETVEEHRLPPENYEIDPETAETINAAKRAGRRVVAIGTTTARALESATDSRGLLRAERNRTELFIYPGYQFRLIDALFTNFHLPQSSLLMLVSAFAGRELTMAAYLHAVAEKYRFYSYGDCMIIGNWLVGNGV